MQPRRWPLFGPLLLLLALLPAPPKLAAAPGPVVERLAGDDRYATAAAVSRHGFRDGAEVAYLANGARFPDALAGGAAAGGRGPVLLVRDTDLPRDTARELQRLKPGRVIVLGGTAAVPASVATAASSATGAVVSRLEGDDRYQTAARISADTFSPGVPVAYIATGEDFPDALAASAAASAEGGPVLLVPGGGIPAAVEAELRRLHPGRIVVTGGTAKVSPQVEQALRSYTTGPVLRTAGPDRYATAVATAKPASLGASTVYLTTGLGFPDALAAAAVAGRSSAPVLLVPPSDLPEVVACELDRLRPASLFLVGGTTAVSEGLAQRLRAGGPFATRDCPQPPSPPPIASGTPPLRDQTNGLVPAIPMPPAVADQLNPAHTGGAADADPAKVALRRAWKLDLDHNWFPTAPIIAEGKVFLVTARGPGPRSAQVVAVDAATGLQVWGSDLPDLDFPDWTGVAYDRGLVFVQNIGGRLFAFDAATGVQRWETPLRDDVGIYTTDPPTAADGRVYSGGAAVEASTGRVLFRFVGGGSPTVADGDLYTSSRCVVRRLDAGTGALRWESKQTGACLDSVTVAVHGGRVYPRTERPSAEVQVSPVLDARTGAEVGRHPGMFIPALGESRGYYLDRLENLAMVPVGSERQSWMFAGEAPLLTAPIVLNGAVYVGSRFGHVYALDGVSGRMLWRDVIEPGHTHEILHLGAGEGTLVAVTHEAVVAYRGEPAIEPAPEPPSLPSPTPEPTAGPTSSARGQVPPIPATPVTTYQLNLAHTGSTSDGRTQRQPLTRQWSIGLGGWASHAILAEGKVFAVVWSRSAPGCRLWALEAGSGRPLWADDVDGCRGITGIGYDGGNVFLLTAGVPNLVEEVDAGTGARRWSRWWYASDAAPVASGGKVFVSGHGALDPGNGAFLWLGRTPMVGNSTSAIANGGLYVGSACQQVYDLSPMTGALIWRHDTGCLAGGGATVAVHRGRVFARERGPDDAGNLVLDAATGQVLGTHPGLFIPAFDGPRGFFVTADRILVAKDIDSGRELWRFAGDSRLELPPIVVNGAVYVATTSGHLYALDGGTGATLWEDETGSPIVLAPQDVPRSQEWLRGFSAGEGTLVVSTDRALIAYR